MNAPDLHSEIRNFCKSNTNEALVLKYSRYFKEGYDAYGLTQNLMHEKTKSILAHKSVDFQLIRETAKLLVKGSKYEETAFAILLYKSCSISFNKDTFKDIGEWFETGINNWAHCDVICGELLFILLNKELINIKDFKPWLKAKNKFQRRAVPVAMVKLLKNRDDLSSLFSLIEPLMTDSEREVHQGVGWFLREAWKRKKSETESFLLRWKEKSPRLIFQYACEKMEHEDKLRFKRTK